MPKHLSHRSVYFILAAFVVLNSFSVSGTSQTIMVDQPMLNPGRNFSALTGYHGAMQLNLNSVGSSGAPYVQTASADVFIGSVSTAFGIDASFSSFYDKFNEKRITLRVAPRFRIGEHTELLLGGGMSLFQSQLQEYSVYFGPPQYSDFLHSYGITRIPHARTMTSNGASGMLSVGLKHQNTLVAYHFEYSEQENFVPDFDVNVAPIHRLYITQQMNLGDRLRLFPSLYLQNQGAQNIFTGALSLNFDNLYLATGYTFRNEAENDVVDQHSNSFQLAYEIKQCVLVSSSVVFQKRFEQRETFGQLGIRVTLFKGRSKHALTEHLPML